MSFVMFLSSCLCFSDQFFGRNPASDYVGVPSTSSAAADLLADVDLGGDLAWDAVGAL
jgi:hypothetical protein